MQKEHPLLEVRDLSVTVEEQVILKGISLALGAGEVHAIMGPNGSGKSTLSYTIMGHPSYIVTEGSIQFNGEDLAVLSVDERARKGIFLAFQYPYEIEGLTFKDFLRQAYNACYAGTEKQIGLKEFRVLLEDKMQLLGIDPLFIERSMNVGFSGGEKKRAEMLQFTVLQPKLVILDEIDSGLDIDSLKRVCKCLALIKANQPTLGILLITHYQRILNHITPDVVHVVQDGRIVRSGPAALAEQVEHEGYEQ